MIHIELFFPGDADWVDVSDLVRAETYNEHKQIMNDSRKSVVDTACFNLIYDQLIVAKFLSVQPKQKILVRTFDEDFNPSFTGYVASNFKHETRDLPEEIRIKIRDNSWKLDKPISEDIKIPASIASGGISVYSCFSQIAQISGFSAGQIEPAHGYGFETVASIYEMKGDLSYRAILDSLLSDYGYVLTTTAVGNLKIYNLLESGYSIQGTVSGQVSVCEPFSISRQDEDQDGVKVIWSALSILDDVSLYKSSLPMGSDGIPTGLIIPAGGYYPEYGDSIEIFQDYKQDWLDRPYLSKTNREKNKDISLITTENHRLVITADDGITHFETFGPKQGKVLFHNPTGGNLKIYVFEIWGKALFRDQIRETLLPTTAKDPRSERAEHIFSTADAERLADGLFTLQQYADIEYSFTLYDRTFDPGDRISIDQVDPAISTDAIIIEIDWTDELPGFKYRAVGLAEFGDLSAITTAYHASKLAEKGEKGTPATTVEIISTNGTVFRMASISSSLEIRVYRDGVDITNMFLNSDFRWYRASENSSEDAIWNSAHYSTGGKILSVDETDINGRTVFFCDLLS